MAANKRTNRIVNIINVTSAASAFGTGLLMFFCFHVGHGHNAQELWGVGKPLWLNIHRAAAILFSCGLATHIALHWSYIKTVARRWRGNLAPKMKKRSKEQIQLIAATCIVVFAGFIAWAFLPGGAAGFTEARHHVIDVHNIIGLLTLAGLAIHIARRWDRMFETRKRAGAKTKRQRQSLPMPIPSPSVAKVHHLRGAALLFHNPFGRHHSTRFVTVNLHACTACGNCAAACPNGVLEIIALGPHRHTHVSHADRCKGCKRCVAACPNGAFAPAAKAANG